ncbi:MAG: hypothetical protein NT121_08580, partial [Chloroflexi bacterium]|nr:hypothetical protein [Chloroflexota bacterium]
MNTFLLFATVAALIALSWMSCRYLALRRSADDYARSIRRSADGDLSPRSLPADIKNLEAVSSAVRALNQAFDQRLTRLEAERARLEATLTQMTDGILIADAQGKIRMSN